MPSGRMAQCLNEAWTRQLAGCLGVRTQSAKTLATAGRPDAVPDIR